MINLDYLESKHDTRRDKSRVCVCVCVKAVLLYARYNGIVVKLRAHNTIELSIDSRNRNTFAVRKYAMFSSRF